MSDLRCTGMYHGCSTGTHTTRLSFGCWCRYLWGACTRYLTTHSHGHPRTSVMVREISTRTSTVLCETDGLPEPVVATSWCPRRSVILCRSVVTRCFRFDIAGCGCFGVGRGQDWYFGFGTSQWKIFVDWWIRFRRFVNGYFDPSCSHKCDVWCEVGFVKYRWHILETKDTATVYWELKFVLPRLDCKFELGYIGRQLFKPSHHRCFPISTI